MNTELTTKRSKYYVDFEPPPPPDNLAELIALVRSRILEMHKEDPKRFHPTDIDKYILNGGDWPLTTYLRQENYRIDETVGHIKRALEWSAREEIYTLVDDTFPTEVHRIGGIFNYEPDRWGNVTYYNRIRVLRPTSWHREATKRFVMHKFSQVIFESEGRGIAVIADMSGSSIFNFDLQLLYFMVDAYFRYSPHDVRYILLYNLPMLLSWTLTVVKAAFPASYRNMIQVVHGEELFEYIEPANVPPYLGGTCRRNYLKVPRECFSIEVANNSERYTKDELCRIIKHYQSRVEEADAEEERYFSGENHEK